MADQPSPPHDVPKRRPGEPDTVDPSGAPSTVGYGRGEGQADAAPALRRAAVPARLPAQFGRYRLERLLGKGGMAAVYLAYDTQLDRPVALKVPRFRGDDEGPQRERFFREARAAATLRHPNLCPVYDIGEHDGVCYLTMAYIDGKPMSAYLPGKKPVPLQKAAALVRVLARALQEAHEAGVIHRDLKPANILISRKKEPIITDFGLARRAAADDQRLTQSGAMMGTPAYMPPEQVNGDVGAMGPGCDIYSLGVILYELLAGRRPFEGPTGLLMAQIVMDPPPPLDEFRPGVDPALEAVCVKALAKRPADRYPSMRAFAAALDEWLAGEAPAAPGPARARAPSADPETLDDEGGPEDEADEEPAPAPRRPAAPPRRARKRRGPALELTSGRAWFLLVAGVLFVTCVLPAGCVAVLFYSAVHKVSEQAGKAGTFFENLQKEQKKEQERQAEDRKRERQHWEEAARDWKPPPADAGADRLFPAAVAGYRLERSDDKADVPDLNVSAPGWHAVYRGPAGAVDLFAYRATRLEKEALLRRATEALNAKGMPRLFTGGANLRGSAQDTFLSYDLGPAPPEPGQSGTFWWQEGWLFLARSPDRDEPAALLRAYLAEVGREP
jgi:hypothetical protein